MIKKYLFHFILAVLLSVLFSFLLGCQNNELSISSFPDESPKSTEYEEAGIQDSMSFSDAGSGANSDTAISSDSGTGSDAGADASSGSACVYLCGAVKNTGVYYFNEGERLWEIVKKAGGLDEDADTDAINMAAVLNDGEKIRIPYIGENIVSEEDSLININTASADELCTIPGIGPARANAIIAYREEIGGRFENIEQLKEVSGIKDGSFNKIKPYICAK